MMHEQYVEIMKQTYTPIHPRVVVPDRHVGEWCVVCAAFTDGKHRCADCGHGRDSEQEGQYD